MPPNETNPTGLPAPHVLSREVEAAVASAGVAVWQTDLVTGDQFWSAYGLALYGLPPGAPAPSMAQWRDHFLHPDDRERAALRAAEMRLTGKPYVLDHRIVRADGDVRWLHTRGALAPGDARRLVGISIDITERKDMEARAGEALKVLDLSASYVGFGIGYRDVGAPQAEWGAQLKVMLGFDPQGPTPTREQFLAVVEPEFRDRVLAESTRIMEVGGADFEFAARRRSDNQRRIIMVRTLVIGDSAQRPLRRYFAMVDVTEARERERQLAEVLERLQQATEASGIGTWERDAITGEGHWDDTALALVDLPPGSPAMSLDALMTLVHPDDRAYVQRQWQRMDETGEAADMQYRLVLPDGRTRWLQSRGRSQLDAQGRVLKRSGICYDISERHAAEEAREQRALAERANAAKTEFLSRMSHELRTPLNAVLGFAQLLSIDSQEPPSPRQKERIDHILAAGWHLLALINDVLDLTRIEARQLQIEMAVVDLANVFAQSVAMNQVAAQEHEVRLQVQPLPAGSTQVWADATRLRQLLLNLLSNAIKYNVRGGLVTLSARPLADSGMVEITVVDTGLGMTENQLAQLFQPFNRLGREHSGVEGSGIGLIVAKLLAEQMGGRLEVESRAGQGSTFRIVLAIRAP